MKQIQGDFGAFEARAYVFHSIGLSPEWVMNESIRQQMEGRTRRFNRTEKDITAQAKIIETKLLEGGKQI